MIKYTLKLNRKKIADHAYSMNYTIKVPGFSPTTETQLTRMIERSIQDELRSVNKFIFEDEKTFKEKIKLVEQRCKELAEGVFAEKKRVDDLKANIGLPIEEQKIEPRRKNTTTKKT